MGGCAPIVLLRLPHSSVSNYKEMLDVQDQIVLENDGGVCAFIRHHRVDTFFVCPGQSLIVIQSLIPMVSGGTGENGNSNPINEGVATYYYATGDGACLFGPSLPAI